MEDLAEHMRWLVDIRYPEMEKSRVVLDNLNTPTPTSLSEAFALAEARRIVKKLALHDTPKHSSWLTKPTSSCVSGNDNVWRAVYRTKPCSPVRSLRYEGARNASHATIQWRCTTTAAREKLHRLYPSHPKRQASRSHRATSVLGLIC